MKNTLEKHLTGLELCDVELVTAVARISKEMSIPYMLIGAFARDIWLKHCHGLKPPRKTIDLDFAVYVNDWDQYKGLKKLLISKEFFSASNNPNHPQRLHSSTNIPLDILPFGGVEEKSETGLVIKWPDDNTEMSVEGFQQAYKMATIFKLSHNDCIYDLPVLTIPGIVILKLVTWIDRGDDSRRKKHVDDIYFIIKNYPILNSNAVNNIDNWDMLPTEEIEINAFLLGRDMKNFGDIMLLTKIANLLHRESTSSSKCILSHDIKRHCRGSFPKARSIIKYLYEGLTQ